MLRSCKKNPTSIEDVIQQKNWSFSILVVWRFDANRHTTYYSLLSAGFNPLTKYHIYLTTMSNS